MYRLRNSVLPQTLKIVLLLFVMAAVTADDITAQNLAPGANPAFRQAVCNDDPGDLDRHAGKIPTYEAKDDNDTDVPGHVIKTYLDQAAGFIMPAPPATFFQPDRAPPVSFL